MTPDDPGLTNGGKPGKYPRRSFYKLLFNRKSNVTDPIRSTYHAIGASK